MKIIIAGAGNVGTHLAKLLSREKQDIILMDDDEEKLSALRASKKPTCSSQSHRTKAAT